MKRRAFVSRILGVVAATAAAPSVIDAVHMSAPMEHPETPLAYDMWYQDVTNEAMGMFIRSTRTEMWKPK